MLPDGRCRQMQADATVQRCGRCIWRRRARGLGLAGVIAMYLLVLQGAYSVKLEKPSRDTQQVPTGSLRLTDLEKYTYLGAQACGKHKGRSVHVGCTLHAPANSESLPALDSLHRSQRARWHGRDET